MPLLGASGAALYAGTCTGHGTGTGSSHHPGLGGGVLPGPPCPLPSGYDPRVVPQSVAAMNATTLWPPTPQLPLTPLGALRNVVINGILPIVDLDLLTPHPTPTIHTVTVVMPIPNSPPAPILNLLEHIGVHLVLWQVERHQRDILGRHSLLVSRFGSMVVALQGSVTHLVMAHQHSHVTLLSRDAVLMFLSVINYGKNENLFLGLPSSKQLLKRLVREWVSIQNMLQRPEIKQKNVIRVKVAK